jgi:hypothetical protein
MKPAAASRFITLWRVVEMLRRGALVTGGTA